METELFFGWNVDNYLLVNIHVSCVFVWLNLQFSPSANWKIPNCFLVESTVSLFENPFSSYRTPQLFCWQQKQPLLVNGYENHVFVPLFNFQVCWSIESFFVSQCNMIWFKQIRDLQVQCIHIYIYTYIYTHNIIICFKKSQISKSFNVKQPAIGFQAISACLTEADGLTSSEGALNRGARTVCRHYLNGLCMKGGTGTESFVWGRNVFERWQLIDMNRWMLLLLLLFFCFLIGHKSQLCSKWSFVCLVLRDRRISARNPNFNPPISGLVPPMHYITGYLHAVFTT